MKQALLPVDVGAALGFLLRCARFARQGRTPARSDGHGVRLMKG